MRASKPLTLTLGKYRGEIEKRLNSGAYESASEVVRAALRALEREERAIEDMMREKVRKALADPRPDQPLEDVVRHFERRYETSIKT